MVLAAPPPPLPASPPSRSSGRTGRRRETLLAVALLVPSAVVFVAFVFYPLVRTFYLGTLRSDPFGLSQTYVGLDQYRDVLTSDGFRNSLGVTVAFTLLTVPAGLVLGTGLAVMAHQRLAGIEVFRTIFSSTVATSVAVASVMFLTLLNPQIGLLNYFLKETGNEPVVWLRDPGWALFAVSLATVWQNLGFTFIVLTAGLAAVPEELYESARLDGAGPLSRFVHVTIPMLSPTLLFAVVVLTINAFQSFGQIDILTQGGPLDRTNVIVYSIYRQAFQFFDRGAAAAQAVVLFLVVLALTLLQFRLLERRVSYGR